MKLSARWMLPVFGGSLLTTLACSEPSRLTPLAPAPHFGLSARLSVGEEEIIGDGILGTTTFYHTYGGHKHALYQVCAEEAGGCMFYNGESSQNRWGYFTTKNVDCTSNNEAHDTNGDGVVESSDPETHCVPNGRYTISLYRRFFTNGNLDSSRVIFERNVAMLDSLGQDEEDSTTTAYHDVHVLFDLGAASTTLSGEIRMGPEYRTIEDTSDFYPNVRSDTIGSGDTLWFISTVRASGGDSRSWYNSATGVLTGFRFDDGTSTVLRGSVNSQPTPQTYTKPLLHEFIGRSGTMPFSVAGQVTEPDQDGIGTPGTILGDSLLVTVVGATACFSYSSGTLYVGQAVSFDASCSSGWTALQYSWDFGDGSGATAWSSSSTIQHAFSSGGNHNVALSTRRGVRHTDTDDSTRVVSIAAFSVYITGPDLIESSDSYTWEAHPQGGTTPLHYQWYYKQGGADSSAVGGDSATYTRYVSVGKTNFTFRLRVVVTDSVQRTATHLYWVEVVSGGGDFADVGAIDTEGRCAALPSVRARRQAALNDIAAAGRWPTPCRLR